LSAGVLQRHSQEGEDLLQQTVTDDETWVHHYEPCSKQQIMEWEHPTFPETKKFKSQASAGKVMLLLFWDSNGLILEHYLEQGTTVTAA
jgi:hypothetical protein